jgi:hypothetical protein
MENKEEIISRLKFISHIKKDEKIFVRYISKQNNNLITRILRTTLYPDNRWNTIRFIKDIINSSFEILEKYMQEDNTIIVQSLLADLIKSKQGIINLKQTYGYDVKFCCDVDIILENMISKVLQIKHKNNDLFLALPEIKL